MSLESKRDGDAAGASEPLPRGGQLSDTASEAVAAPVERLNYLILSLASFCAIVFGVWLVSAGKGYRQEYAQINDGWRLGSVRMVELTVVKEDKRNLGCAASHEVAGLHCGGEREDGSDPRVLQPYNTVANQLLLGAGLWTSLDRDGALPEGRFTVVCNYTIKGVLKSAGIRFAPTATFGPLDKTITAGTLTECSIPR